MMVFGFDREHPIGVICRFPCAYCHDVSGKPELSLMTAANGEIVDFHPLKNCSASHAR